MEKLGHKKSDSSYGDGDRMHVYDVQKDYSSVVEDFSYWKDCITEKILSAAVLKGCVNTALKRLELGLFFCHQRFILLGGLDHRKNNY